MKIMDEIKTASQEIKQCSVIAILRGDFSIVDMLRIAEALRAGTVTVMEVTLNSPSALTSLPQLRHHFRDEMLIGPGTVRDVKQAQQAIEAQTAFAAGCKMFKLFPMDTFAGGPAYLKALRAPLNDIYFVPTGGVALENIAAYARAGAVAVGMGSKLVPDRKITSRELTTRARALRQAWERARNV
jgi:2-dehydro-3-deoxyphosphogluconate aldolase/(4S)-4-hydroxy-2-oxoglutarate aldolase